MTAIDHTCRLINAELAAGKRLDWLEVPIDHYAKLCDELSLIDGFCWADRVHLDHGFMSVMFMGVAVRPS